MKNESKTTRETILGGLGRPGSPRRQQKTVKKLKSGFRGTRPNPSKKAFLGQRGTTVILLGTILTISLVLAAQITQNNNLPTDQQLTHNGEKSHKNRILEVKYIRFEGLSFQLGGVIALFFKAFQTAAIILIFMELCRRYSIKMAMQKGPNEASRLSRAALYQIGGGSSTGRGPVIPELPTGVMGAATPSRSLTARIRRGGLAGRGGRRPDLTMSRLGCCPRFYVKPLHLLRTVTLFFGLAGLGFIGLPYNAHALSNTQPEATDGAVLAKEMSLSPLESYFTSNPYYRYMGSTVIYSLNKAIYNPVSIALFRFPVTSAGESLDIFLNRRIFEWPPFLILCLCSLFGVYCILSRGSEALKLCNTARFTLSLCLLPLFAYEFLYTIKQQDFIQKVNAEARAAPGTSSTLSTDSEITDQGVDVQFFEYQIGYFLSVIFFFVMVGDWLYFTYNSLAFTLVRRRRIQSFFRVPRRTQSQQNSSTQITRTLHHRAANPISSHPHTRNTSINGPADLIETNQDRNNRLFQESLNRPSRLQIALDRLLSEHPTSIKALSAELTRSMMSNRAINPEISTTKIFFAKNYNLLWSLRWLVLPFLSYLLSDSEQTAMFIAVAVNAVYLFYAIMLKNNTLLASPATARILVTEEFFVSLFSFAASLIWVDNGSEEGVGYSDGFVWVLVVVIVIAFLGALICEVFAGIGNCIGVVRQERVVPVFKRTAVNRDRVGSPRIEENTGARQNREDIVFTKATTNMTSNGNSATIHPNSANNGSMNILGKAKGAEKKEKKNEKINKIEKKDKKAKSKVNPEKPAKSSKSIKKGVVKGKKGANGADDPPRGQIPGNLEELLSGNQDKETKDMSVMESKLSKLSDEEEKAQVEFTDEDDYEFDFASSKDGNEDADKSSTDSVQIRMPYNEFIKQEEVEPINMGACEIMVEPSVSKPMGKMTKRERLMAERSTYSMSSSYSFAFDSEDNSRQVSEAEGAVLDLEKQFTEVNQKRSKKGKSGGGGARQESGSRRLAPINRQVGTGQRQNLLRTNQRANSRNRLETRIRERLLHQQRIKDLRARADEIIKRKASVESKRSQAAEAGGGGSGRVDTKISLKDFVGTMGDGSVRVFVESSDSMPKTEKLVESVEAGLVIENMDNEGGNKRVGARNEDPNDLNFLADSSSKEDFIVKEGLVQNGKDVVKKTQEVTEQVGNDGRVRMEPVRMAGSGFLKNVGSRRSRGSKVSRKPSEGGVMGAGVNMEVVVSRKKSKGTKKKFGSKKKMHLRKNSKVVQGGFGGGRARKGNPLGPQKAHKRQVSGNPDLNGVTKTIKSSLSNMNFLLD